jgi:hypothetical protein
VRLHPIFGLKGVGITNGWHTCNHVDSMQDAWLALFWQLWSGIETDQNGRRAIEMFWRFRCQNRNGSKQIKMIEINRNKSK